MNETKGFSTTVPFKDGLTFYPNSADFSFKKLSRSELLEVFFYFSSALEYNMFQNHINQHFFHFVQRNAT